MAQGDGYIYNKAKQRILAGEIDLDGHTLGVEVHVSHHLPVRPTL